MEFRTARPLRGLGWLREPINALTHGLGALLGSVGLIVLLVRADGEPARVASALVYGVSLVLLFVASTLLHAIRAGADRLRVFRVLDHAAIFVLIAGTYTPITLIPLREANPAVGWTLFGLVWTLAFLGVLFKLFWIGAPRWVSTGLYLLLGWLAVVAIRPLISALPPAALAWLVAGGLAYSIGAVIYAVKRPDPFPRVFGYHEIWHLFVLAGAAAHFVLIAQFVLVA